MTPQQASSININEALMNIQRKGGHEYLNYDGACGWVTRQPQTGNRQIDLLCFLTSASSSGAAPLTGFINSN